MPEPGGAFSLEGSTLTGAQRALIEAVSAAYLDGSEPMDTTLRNLLRALPEAAEAPRARLRGGFTLPEETREKFNGWGGFARGGYVIDLLPGRPTPAPWCNVLVNAACPGWVRTDMGGEGAPRTPAQGADTPVWLATLPDGGPSGGFFRDREPIPW